MLTTRILTIMIALLLGVPSASAGDYAYRDIMGFSADGKYAGVSNADSDDASILDIAREKEIARIKVGKAPKRVLVIEVPQDQLTEK